MSRPSSITESQEPVAYAVFAENGNIRVWSHYPAQVERLREEFGDDLEPLYRQTVDVSALVETLGKARSAVATLAGIRSDNVYEGDLEQASELISLTKEIDAAISTYRNQGGEA